MASASLSKIVSAHKLSVSLVVLNNGSDVRMLSFVVKCLLRRTITTIMTVISNIYCAKNGKAGELLRATTNAFEGRMWPRAAVWRPLAYADIYMDRRNKMTSGN